MRQVKPRFEILVVYAVFLLACSTAQGVESEPGPSEQPSRETPSQEDFKEFPNCRIVPRLGNPWDYTFEPGKFP